jgi:dephospho-CoA kinase
MGSGKSLVAEEFARRGARVVSGDRLGHEGLRQPAIRDQLVGRWGKDVLDEQGEIDRRKVSAIVFANPDERKALEAAVHPFIERRFREEVAAADADPAVKFIVLDAAVMLEAGWDRGCDRLVFVHAPREQRLQRLAQQRGWTAADVQARESAQMPLDEKRRRANDVIDNAGSREELARQVADLLRRWGLAETA